MKPEKEIFQAIQSELIIMCCYADTMTTQPEILMSTKRSSETRKLSLKRNTYIFIQHLHNEIKHDLCKTHSTPQQGQDFQCWCAHRRTCRIKTKVTKLIRKQSVTPED